MGPLAGIRILEIAGIGPVPYCAMVLSDLGAQVTRIDRPDAAELGLPVPPHLDIVSRGRASIVVDLKKPGATDVVLRLLEDYDGLIEGMRPGVMERLGLGPDVCLQRRPSLAYGRATGWGQDGPLAQTAGHDINYIALAGILGAMGPAEGNPTPPLNIIGDYAGGALFLALGMLAAIIAARESGRGQVVDAAMVDGAAHLMSIFHALKAGGRWSGARGANVLDGGAPYYRTYETRDGKHVAVGAIEPKFYAQLLTGLELEAGELPAQDDRSAWPALCERFAAVFKQRDRDAWVAVFEGTDACVAPVLGMNEIADHPHNAARGMLTSGGGVQQPAPAPRFSRSKSETLHAPVKRGTNSRSVLGDAGFSDAEIEGLLAAGVVHEAAA